MSTRGMPPGAVGDLWEFIRGARGEVDPDLLLRGGRVVNVFTHEIVETAVAVRGDRVVGFGDSPAGEVIDLDGRYVCPGLIDPHVHIEISMMPPHRFADAVLPHGVTSVVCDPHEIANVLGVEGVRYMLDVSEGLDLSVFVMAPSCVPTSSMETSGASLGAEDLIALAEHPRVLGLAEMMNFPGVLAGSEEVLGKLCRFGGRTSRRARPGLDRSRSPGVRRGWHLERSRVGHRGGGAGKVAVGMAVFLREASNARNLIDVLPAVSEYTARRCSFATDDRVPGERLARRVDRLAGPSRGSRRS